LAVRVPFYCHAKQIAKPLATLHTASMTLLQTIVAIAALNWLAFMMMWYDKRMAERRGWRVPESSFFALGLLGATPGIWFAMRRFRHKTIKGRFKWRIYAIIWLQVLLIGVLSLGLL
jgi:uncharacterized membrane protein YsdA (DUF1294 family)